MGIDQKNTRGLIAALKIFANEDEDAENKRLQEVCRKVVDALIEVPGLRVTVEHDDYVYLTPHALIKFTKEWQGPSRDEVVNAMVNGDPAIYMHTLGNPDEFAIAPDNLDDQELETVIRRLREELV